MSPDISLALPTYNERDNIIGVLQASVASLDSLKRSWEIVVIDNHSSDDTVQRVREFIESNDYPVRLIVHDSNRLYSGSCRTAIKEADGKYIAIMDADGQCNAGDIPRFIERIEAGADLVFGWRVKRNDPVTRSLISRVFNLLGRLWFGFPFHDLNCGFRMFDRRFAEIAEIKYEINMSNPELYVRASNHHLKMDEVEVHHYERRGGTTSHNLKKLFNIFIDVNRYFAFLRRELASN